MPLKMQAVAGAAVTAAAQVGGLDSGARAGVPGRLAVAHVAGRDATPPFPLQTRPQGCAAAAVARPEGAAAVGAASSRQTAPSRHAPACRPAAVSQAGWACRWVAVSSSS